MNIVRLRTTFLTALLVCLALATKEPNEATSDEAATTAAAAATAGRTSAMSYGVDVSFPIFGQVSTNYPDLPHNVDPSHHTAPPLLQNTPLQILGDRQAVYARHLEACRRAYAPTNESHKCDHFEYERLLLNRRQPQSLKNLTTTGFHKVRAPQRLVELLEQFWTHNAGQAKSEIWPAGNTHVNSWEGLAPALVSVDDTTLRGSGVALKRELWAASSAVVEEWTQQELQPCSLYGIRVYHDGDYMLPHVDRLPLVVSAMINVAQDVDEPWPLEVYDHNGMAHNVTLDPGDLLLFESASVIHGHPFPLKGRYYASIFIHFEPSGREYHKSKDGHFFLKGRSNNIDNNRSKAQWDFQRVKAANQEYHDHVKAGHGGPSATLELGRLPPYIVAGSPEEEHWRRLHPAGWSPPNDILPPEAHIAAKTGQLKDLEKQLEEGRVAVLTERDDQGWQVLHQGVASGNEEIVKLLVSHGAEINSRTHGGYGETPLRIAEKMHGTSSSIYRYLKKMGALSIGPEL